MGGGGEENQSLLEENQKYKKEDEDFCKQKENIELLNKENGHLMKVVNNKVVNTYES